MKEFINYFIHKGGYLTVLNGLLTTLQIAVLGLLIGILIGTIIAVVRVMPKYKRLPRILDGICNVYVFVFRGVPLAAQLLIGYWVLLPAFGVEVSDPTFVAIIMFGLNSAAYVSEIMRSGIQSVDVGQLEAARALGMPYAMAMLKIVIPQSLKNILPTLGNEFIMLIKDTSVVFVISVIDLSTAFQQIGSANSEYVIPYMFMTLIYLGLVFGITMLIRFIERRLKKSER